MYIADIYVNKLLYGCSASKLSASCLCKQHVNPTCRTIVLFNKRTVCVTSASTRVLYFDDKYYAELECKSALRDGACPPDQSAIYVYARQYETGAELLEKIRTKLLHSTRGCYDMDQLQLTPQNSQCS